MLLTNTNTLTLNLTNLFFFFFFFTSLLSLTSARPQWAAITAPDNLTGQDDLVIVGFHSSTSEIQNLRVNLGADGQGILRFNNTMASTDSTWSGNSDLPEYMDIHKAYVQCAPPDIECELRAIGDVKIYGWKFDQCSPLTKYEGVPRIIGVNCNRKGGSGAN